MSNERSNAKYWHLHYSNHKCTLLVSPLHSLVGELSQVPWACKRLEAIMCIFEPVYTIPYAMLCIVYNHLQ